MRTQSGGLCGQALPRTNVDYIIEIFPIVKRKDVGSVTGAWESRTKEWGT